MIKTVRDFENWPRERGGAPIFTCSEDAIFYAHLIVQEVIERLKIVHLREKVLADLKVMRFMNNPNLDRMMNLAVKGQFYRECLEEVERIEKEGS